MKKGIIFGNCQSVAIREMLKVKTVGIDWIDFPRVDEISKKDVERLHQEIKEADYIFLQRVNDEYRNSLGVGTNTLTKLANVQVFTFPSIYWNGYNPELCYFKNLDGSTIPGFYGYHNKVIYYCYMMGATVEETLSFLNSQDAILEIDDISLSFETLREREGTLDVKVSDYIERNYKERRLFHTINHPDNALLEYVCDELMLKANIKAKVHNLNPSKEYLGFTRYPILPAVNRALKLNFKDGQGYLIKDEKIDSENLVRRFFDFYNNNREILSFNKKRIKVKPANQVRDCAILLGSRLNLELVQCKGHCKVYFENFSKNFHIEIIPRAIDNYEIALHIEGVGEEEKYKTIVGMVAAINNAQAIYGQNQLSAKIFSNNLNECAKVITDLHKSSKTLLEMVMK